MSVVPRYAIRFLTYVLAGSAGFFAAVPALPWVDVQDTVLLLIGAAMYIPLHLVVALSEVDWRGVRRRAIVLALVLFITAVILAMAGLGAVTLLPGTAVLYPLVTLTGLVFRPDPASQRGGAGPRFPSE